MIDLERVVEELGHTQRRLETQIAGLEGRVEEFNSGLHTIMDTINTHLGETTDVHGISDTGNLATEAYADAAEADAKTYADGAADDAEAAAKTYADGILATHAADTTTHGTGASPIASESYADDVEAAAKTYADDLVSDMATQTWVNGQDFATEDYVDTAESDANDYAEAWANQVMLDHMGSCINYAT